ncbi:phosphoribosylanthranilate isomerase [Spirulina sp. CS-785/01]|uniref:phosphoribosylanthranilate isomerase n=1 Tax=Spirulina sp. CS-785/01 TaxID=3021716 RepID=UPI00232B6A5A|nr:phosphoribosylanthranilate isomerase [Spirulina sp. CS-785/01]MDB9315820.1 phosphoribosylanthranilate isomerase [Spirulina sp. CS-785/01]
MQVKICGITQAEQGKAIAELGATALGFICVRRSPRYVTPNQIENIISQLPATVEKIGVFVHAELPELRQIVQETGLTGIQLHGEESPDYCRQVRQQFPQVRLIKAWRVRNAEDLNAILPYNNWVDSFLLDAYHPQQYGGTGIALNWTLLQNFTPQQPWFLAGGLNPDNILEALNNCHPQGIDLSSGVERSPGDKDLNKVQQLFQVLKPSNPRNSAGDELN